MIKEIKAPIPAAFEDFGLSLRQTMNKIKPAIGTKNPKKPQPIAPLSSGLDCFAVVLKFVG